MRFTYILPFLCLCVSAKAIDCTGYIINKSGDTTKGLIEIKTVYEELVGKKEVIDFPTVETQIKFSDGFSKKKKMDEKGINGFGFTYENQWYHFTFLDLKKDKVKKGVQIIYRDVSPFNKFFVRRIEVGYLTIYKHYFQPEYNSKKSYMKENSWWIGQVYIKHPELGYIDIAPPDMSQRDFKKFQLNDLKMENEFVTTVAAKYGWDDAEKVLKVYNAWKK